MSGQDARVPGSHGSHGWKDCLLASRPCERAERPGRGPSVKLTGFPGDQAPGGEDEVQVLVGLFSVCLSHCARLPGQAWALSHWTCSPPRSPPPRFSTAILGSHHPPGSTSRSSLTQSLRRRTQNPQLLWVYLSEWVARCHYPACHTGPLSSRSSFVSASLNDCGRSPSLGLLICTGEGLH